MDDKKKIPWERIQARLDDLDCSQSWLAGRLNIATNVVTNWKTRGGAPMSRAREIARAFGVSVEEVLHGNSGRQDLSRNAQRLVATLADMDRRGVISDPVEQAIHAFLVVLEGAAGAAPRRKR